MRKARWDLVALTASSVLIGDQVTKLFVLTFLGPGGIIREIPIIPGILRFIYVENTGAAFGLFQGRNPLLALLALVVVVLIAIWFRQVIVWRLGALALGLQLGGAVGNLLDRLRHGFVIDFIDFSFWPTFNVADSAITIGVLLLAFVVFRFEQNRISSSVEAERASDTGQGRP